MPKSNLSPKRIRTWGIWEWGAESELGRGLPHGKERIHLRLGSHIPGLTWCLDKNATNVISLVANIHASARAMCVE
jgi:hypothetical protein